MDDRGSGFRIDESDGASSPRRSERHRRSTRGARRTATDAAAASRPPQRSVRSARQRTGPSVPQVHHRNGSAHQRPRRAGHRVAGIAIGALALLLVLGVIGYSVTRLLGERPAARADVVAGTPVHVIVDSGATTAAIARQLADLGVIDSAITFRFRVRERAVDGQLRAGEYDLTTGMAHDDVIERMLVGPRAEYVDVTIPEGFTAEQVAARLAARAGLDAAEIMRLCTEGAAEFAVDHPYLEGAYGSSLEGYLFPATYSIETSTSARDVVEMMLDHFDSQVAKLDLSYAESRDLDLGDVVTIASILEREAQIADEFPLVSSVIYNRLARPMKLQLCATVMYTMPDGTTSLTNRDLEQQTPYNTYLHDGLPVGPISNPGLRALEAAAQPAETDYLYYVLTGKDGSQTFTATYDEFLKAKARGQATLGD